MKNKTVKIKVGDDFVVINAADFDPNKGHVIYNPPAKTTKKAD